MSSDLIQEFSRLQRSQSQLHQLMRDNEELEHENRRLKGHGSGPGERIETYESLPSMYGEDA